MRTIKGLRTKGGRSRKPVGKVPIAICDPPSANAQRQTLLMHGRAAPTRRTPIPGRPVTPTAGNRPCSRGPPQPAPWDTRVGTVGHHSRAPWANHSRHRLCARDTTEGYTNPPTLTRWFFVRTTPTLPFPRAMAVQVLDEYCVPELRFTLPRMSRDRSGVSAGVCKLGLLLPRDH